MATPKLWWDGSEWKTTESYWLNGSTWSTGEVWCWILYKARIIAYDDGTVEFKGDVTPNDDVYGSYALSGAKTFSENGSTIATFGDSNRHLTRTLNTTYPKTLAFSGNLSVIRYEQGAHYGQPWNATPSTTPTNPFCTVTFNANGGSDAPSPQTVCIGAACTLSAVQPTRTGYTFSSWNTSADGTGTSYSAGSDITVSEDTTLYAIWSTNEYPVDITADEGVTITFDGENFSNVTTSVNKPYGKVCAYSISANTGFIIKTRDPAADGSITIDLTNPSLSATSQRVGCHIDDGNNYVQAVMYVDDGESWQMVQAYVDDGADWGLVY